MHDARDISHIIGRPTDGCPAHNSAPSSPALGAGGSGRGSPGGQGGRGLPQGRADWLRGGVGHMASPAVSGPWCPVVRLHARVRLDGKAAGMVAFNRIGILVVAAASG